MAMTAPTGADPAVALLDDVLFHVDGPRRPGAPLWPGTEEHALVGSAPGVRMLVPLANRRVAAASFVRGTNHRPGRDVAARALARLGMRTGAALPLVPDRYAVRTTRVEGMSDHTLHEHLAEVLGVPRLAIAVNFGPDKPNVKPVLKLMTMDGRTAGYAKVGWNPLTIGLVEHEADFLASVPRDRLRRILLPELVHLGSWRSGRLLVMSPLTGGQRWVSPRNPDGAAFAEVAGLTPVHEVDLGGSEYHRWMERRVATLGDELGDTARLALDAIDARWSDLPLRFGRWHGDWTPWNTGRRHGSLILWDWERTAGDVPVGFDAVHYHFQPRFVRSPGGDLLPPLRQALDAASRPLSDLGVDPAAREALAALYLLELYLRFASSEESGDTGTADLVDRVGRGLRRYLDLLGGGARD